MNLERPVGEDDLQAYVDGRLAPELQDSVTAYLAANPAAAERLASDREQRQALRDRLAFKADEPIPARLRISNILAERKRAGGRRHMAVAAALGWLMVGGITGWFANTVLTETRPGTTALNLPPMANAAVAAHRTFVVEAAHPVEVRADQEAHLVQWLSRRLGQPISAPNLTGKGYRLMGGRLLPSGDSPAALFMYDDDQGTRLTLYVRAGDNKETGFRSERQHDVSAFFWTDRGLGYVVTAALDQDRLLPIAQAIHERLGSAMPPTQRKT